MSKEGLKSIGFWVVICVLVVTNGYSIIKTKKFFDKTQQEYKTIQQELIFSYSLLGTKIDLSEFTALNTKHTFDNTVESNFFFLFFQNYFAVNVFLVLTMF